MASNSMQHWNGNQVCVIDTETTGLDPYFHEIWEIGILALDSNFERRRDVMPFHLYLKPEHPERLNKVAHKMNKEKIDRALVEGIDQEKAKDLLQHWWDKLGLPFRKYGNKQCQVVPLGHNYGFDRGFINRWLGQEYYDDLFHYLYRDSMIAALWLNDRAAMKAEKVPFPKVKLTTMASRLEIPNEDAHNALVDCEMTRQVYQKIIQQSSGLLV